MIRALIFAIVCFIYTVAASAVDQRAALSSDHGTSPRVGAEAKQKTPSLIAVKLAYSPSTPDNPMKGFVPYQSGTLRNRFPHSMTAEYFPLRSLMISPTNFDWKPLETVISAAAKEGNQFGFRVYLDYPTRLTGIPQFLINQGLRTFPYTEFGNTQSVMPDYKDPRLLVALTNFISALGKKYDGDPRIGFIEAGLLGYWGEWHCGTNRTHFAPANVCSEVLAAYRTAFKKTAILVRYPDKANATLPFGYHDDSFCWDTILPADWSFSSRMNSAGAAAIDKWKTQPIGGEVYPELWTCLFSDNSCAPTNQDFKTCVTVTHASWMRNEGVFVKHMPSSTRSRALEAARQLGYEFYVSEVKVNTERESFSVSVAITNNGVAPFYYDWPIQLAAVQNGKVVSTWNTSWKIVQLLPGDPERIMTQRLTNVPQGSFDLLMTVVNPMPGGKPLRFGNTTQNKTLEGWLTLVTVP